jgi:hypothetical protein
MAKVWDPTSTSYIVDTRFATAQPIDQWGMEYPPLALNEVLAYAFNRRDLNAGPNTPDHNGTNTLTPRLWIELVNTLTQASNLGNPPGPNPSGVNLEGWQIAIAPDDVWGRPNPFTGQINYDPNLINTNGQPQRPGNPTVKNAKDATWPKYQTFHKPTQPGDPPLPNVPALRVDIDTSADDPTGNNPYYYVIGPSAVPGEVAANPIEVGMPQQPGGANTTPITYQGVDPGEDTPPTGAAIQPMMNATPQIKPYIIPNSNPQRALQMAAQFQAGTLFEADDDNDKVLDATPGAYYWVYLLRPANPLDPNNGDPRSKVVVDSIRVPYLASINRTQPTPPGFDRTTDITQGAEVNGNEVEILNGVTMQNDTNNPKKRVLQQPNNRQDIYSLGRLQPYRGGQLIPTLATDGNPTTNPRAAQADYRFGFTEQHNATYSTTVGQYGLGIYGRAMQPNNNNPILQVPTTNRIYHTLGQVNRQTNNAEEWDHLPFHDRDFMGVYELAQVPASPPGLFTKQFVELPPDPIGTPVLPATMQDGILTPDPQFPFIQTRPPMVNLKAPPNNQIYGTFQGIQMPRSVIPAYPYLSDNFYYSAEGLNYTADNNPYTPTPVNGRGTPGVGGATGAGWHKMFELFDVPSSAMGSIGPVSAGANFDWYREDLKPGLINLNLIIDEEVFFGLIDDESIPKLSKVYMSVEMGSPPPWNQNPNPNPYAGLVPNLWQVPPPGTQPPLSFPAATIPRVVTQVDARGYPTYTLDGNGNMTWTGSYAMQNRGFDDGNGGGTDPVTGNFVMPMKAAFADFLKLRHGGSGFIFHHSQGPVNAGPVGYDKTYAYTGNNPPPYSGPNTNLLLTTSPSAERPFHSASFPDIDQTIMRPATLPPSFDPATGNLMTPSWLAPQNPAQPVIPPFTPPIPRVPAPTINPPHPNQGNPVSPQDPGVKHIVDTVAWLDPPTNTVPNPTYGSLIFTPVKPSNPQPNTDITLDPFANRRLWLPPATPPRRLFQLPDTLAIQDPNGTGLSTFDTNASEVGDVHTRPDANTNTVVSEARTYIPTGDPTLANVAADLAQAAVVQTNPNPPPLVNLAENPLLLGGYRKQNVSDTRQYTPYRNEWMQKVANLTTVRTHQYAVWITVGFFEVVKAGDPINLIPDELGPEIGLASGNNVRFRGFFVLDRTQSTGFDPSNPADFRKVVAYARRIE